MIALLHHKHASNGSDEGVVAHWADTLRHQYFCGSAYDEDGQPCDTSIMIKFRQLMGGAGVVQPVAQTIEAAVQLMLLGTQEPTLTQAIVSSTVHLIDCCHRKEELGDNLYPVLCASGYNIRWLLRMYAEKGVACPEALSWLRSLTAEAKAAKTRFQEDFAPSHINIEIRFSETSPPEMNISGKDVSQYDFVADNLTSYS